MLKILHTHTHTHIHTHTHTHTHTIELLNLLDLRAISIAPTTCQYVQTVFE